MTYLYTLDSHECFGPFLTNTKAHEWAKQTQHSSYQLVKKPPVYGEPVRNPYTTIDPAA
jgi:hypothetical protein